MLVIDNAEKVLRNEIGKYFELKPNLVRPSSQYLEGSTRKVLLENRVHALAFSLSQCAQSSVKNIEACLSKEGRKLDGKRLLVQVTGQS